MRPLCVIPARGGSKRLPRKNIAHLCGKPLVGWTIEAAIQSGIFDIVRVSTEDDEIADLAQRSGADVTIRRPAHLAGDTVTNVAVCLHVHDVAAAQGEDYDGIVCLQPSSPLRTGADISAAWARFNEQEVDFLVSTTPIDPHFFHWALEEKSDGTWAMVFGRRYMKTRQELPPFYRPNGAIKIARPDALRTQGDFFGPRLAAHVMDEANSVHVATHSDLVHAEALAKCRSAARSI